MYWSSSTNLQDEATSRIQGVWESSGIYLLLLRMQNNYDNKILLSYLVIPKSETFTTRSPETRQFLAACKACFGTNLDFMITEWWAIVGNKDSPGLCEWNLSSPGKPLLHSHLHTCPEKFPVKYNLFWSAGTLSSNHSPETRTPGTWGTAGCTYHTTLPALGGILSCGTGSHSEQNQV